MPGLQVVSAPVQPTLNPQVQSAPTQPTLAPRVLPQAQNQPTLAPKVQSQPQQPTLAPQVQTQPQQGNISSVGTSDNQQPYTPKLSVTEFAQTIKQQYPQYANQDDSKLVGMVLSKYPQYADRVYVPVAAVPDQPGFIKSLVRGIASPFLRVGVTALGAGAFTAERLSALGDQLTGNQAGAVPHLQNAANIENQVNNTGVDLGYFGKVKGIKGPGLDAAGVGAELASNFIGGEGAIGAGENIAKGSLLRAVKTGAVTGLKAGALAGAGIGLQADNPTAGGVLKNTAEGAVGGAITGGALASVPALAVESYRFAKGVKNFISPDVEAAFMKALKPGTNNTGFKGDIKLAAPILTDTEQTLGKPVKNLNDLLDVVKTARQRIWTTVQEQLGGNKDLTIDGNKIADAMTASIDKRFSTQNPAAADRIMATADTYRRAIPVQEAEAFLESANNDLKNFYAKSGFKQKADARNPEIGHVVREADALRTQLNEKISSATGKDFGLLKQQYGALSNLEQVTTKRVNVAERQNPDSFAEQFSNAQAAGKVLKSLANRNFGDALEGAGQAVTAHLIKVRNTSDSLIENAFNQLRKGAPTLKR